MCFWALDAMTPLEKSNQIRSNQLGRQNSGVQTQWHNLSISGPAHQSQPSIYTALLSHGGIFTRDREACQCTIRPHVTHMSLQSQVIIITEIKPKSYPELWHCSSAALWVLLFPSGNANLFLNMMVPPALCVYYLTLSETRLVNHSNIPSKTIVRLVQASYYLCMHPRSFETVGKALLNLKYLKRYFGSHNSRKGRDAFGLIIQW